MLQLVREISISIKIQKTLSQRRGFHFHVAAGFAGDVGPLSGMCVNLVLVDKWLKDLKVRLESQVFATEEENLNAIFLDIYQKAASFLRSCASETADPTLAGEQTGPVSLTSLSFHEERGFGFQSILAPLDPAHHLEFFNTHYLEIVPPDQGARLIRLRSFWRHQVQSDSDYAHEAFKLLKPLMIAEAGLLVSLLEELKGHKLNSGSILSRFEIHDLDAQTTLEN